MYRQCFAVTFYGVILSTQLKGVTLLLVHPLVCRVLGVHVKLSTSTSISHFRSRVLTEVVQ